MLDVRANTIIYQAQVYYTNLINSLVATKSLGKQRLDDWRKADLILGYLQTWGYEPRLATDQDTTNYNYILYALIQLCGINSYPVGSPLTIQGAPTILAGPQGPPGAAGAQGPRGYAGLATDFSIISTSISTVVDSFPISSANAARWDYFIVSNAGNQRASSIVGHWTATLAELADDGADDLVGDTSGCEFSLSISGSTVQLIATITSGTWSIFGSRYFIPNNGLGTGVINNVLPLGQIYIGNASNQATAQTMSGSITINAAGVTAISANVIVNGMISPAAAISLSKLAPLSNSQLVVTNGSGILISSASPTLTELSYVGGVTSAIQIQLNSKLTDVMTTIGDIIIRNASNVTTRLGIGSSNQVLTVIGGVPTWQNAPGGISGLTTGFIPKASSSTTLTNSIISETTGAIVIAGTLEAQGGIRTQASGAYEKAVTVSIGSWNMFSSTSTTVAHGLADITKIRGVDVMILNDSGSSNTPLSRFNDSTNDVQGGIKNIDSTNVTLFIKSGGLYASGSYSGAGNRGYVRIRYEA